MAPAIFKFMGELNWARQFLRCGPKLTFRQFFHLTHLKIFYDGANEACSIGHPRRITWIICRCSLNVIQRTPLWLNPIQGRQLDFLLKVGVLKFIEFFEPESFMFGLQLMRWRHPSFLCSYCCLRPKDLLEFFLLFKSQYQSKTVG